MMLKDFLTLFTKEGYSLPVGWIVTIGLALAALIYWARGWKVRSELDHARALDVERIKLAEEARRKRCADLFDALEYTRQTGHDGLYIGGLVIAAGGDPGSPVPQLRRTLDALAAELGCTPREVDI